MHWSSGGNIAILVNPISGGGQSRMLAGRLARALKGRGMACRILETRKTGTAGSIEPALGPACRTVVSVGGDGTFNALLNQLADPSRIPLAILPTGTANILAKELKLPRDPVSVARAIANGNIRRIDMAMLGRRRFGACVGWGFDAMVTRALAARRGALGYRGYVKPMLSALRRYRPQPLTVSVDGRTPEYGGYVLVSNIKNYGGLFQIAHRAAPDSGFMEVCLLTKGTLWQILLLALTGLGRLTHRVSAAQFIYRSGTRVHVAAPDDVPVQMDGDYHGSGSGTVTIKPRAISLITGP